MLPSICINKMDPLGDHRPVWAELALKKCWDGRSHRGRRQPPFSPGRSASVCRWTLGRRMKENDWGSHWPAVLENDYLSCFKTTFHGTYNFFIVAWYWPWNASRFQFSIVFIPKVFWFYNCFIISGGHLLWPSEICRQSLDRCFWCFYELFFCGGSLFSYAWPGPQGLYILYGQAVSANMLICCTSQVNLSFSISISRRLILSHGMSTCNFSAPLRAQVGYNSQLRTSETRWPLHDRRIGIRKVLDVSGRWHDSHWSSKLQTRWSPRTRMPTRMLTNRDNTYLSCA